MKQEPPLPVSVELGREATAGPALAEAIRERLRAVLVVQTQVDLVPWGSLPRSEYKSSARRAPAMTLILTTVVGSYPQPDG